MTNRRDFLRKASLLTVSGMLAGKAGHVTANTLATHHAAASKIIGLQIYSLGSELHENVPAGMKKIKKMGYSTLELAGYNKGKIGKIDMMEFKKMAEDAGLKITSTHVNPPVREYSPKNKGEIMEFWKKAADDHAKIGVTYLIQPGQPATRSTEEVAYVGEIFNEAGKIAKAAGLSFGYHNHDGEFARVKPGGTEAVAGRRGFGKEVKGIEVIYDAMIKSTDPSLVFFELDVYWAVMGQADPVEYMRKYADRIRVLHIKDRAVLGQTGMMNFEMIFKQARAIGIKDYFVELEKYNGGTQFEGVKGCANYLLKAKFVK
ncbi:sugar phosphate isomerase/epimerase [Parabacteroides sp. 52]|uniref:sugar phosphate isomerase/epimerase family protein n=1 Tax=unclassified Parabacteroides TaxID=2649774 RepID=UPI0013D1836E|nr:MULTISPECIES: sugar phosphate isomerase/epimerase [unclassified Parabacteroides]MDH6535195.1 sugar phosphate isomerase/epimerase [Parabacteroides sp. PM5-20]NDV56317.1 sugar phosphate isomerase/epimerase [Parabacteroides sp. 52]